MNSSTRATPRDPPRSGRVSESASFVKLAPATPASKGASFGSLDALLERVAEVAATRAMEQAAELFGSREDAPILLDRQSLAKRLNISIPTVDRLRGEGMPTIWVTSEAPRFELDRCLEWLRSREAGRIR